MGKKLGYIKAFLGKKRVVKGINQKYMYNPEYGTYGWYNYEAQDLTPKGAYLFESYQGKFDPETREGRFRSNIKTVLDTKLQAIKSNIKNFDGLSQEIVDKLIAMDDDEIEDFCQENKDYIKLFFEYKTYINSYADIDSRTALLAKKLGVDLDKYIINDDVPIEVQNKMKTLESYIDTKRERFE